VAQDELVARIEAEARERRKETEGRPSVTESEKDAIKLPQLIGAVIVDESTDEIVEWDDHPEPQLDPVPTPTKPKPKSHAKESDAILAEARERQIEAGKLYGECHPKEELTQKIGSPLVDESTGVIFRIQ